MNQMYQESFWNVIDPYAIFGCPVCYERFRNDIALLRHERKMDHLNQNRVLRQMKRKYVALGKGQQVQPDGPFVCKDCKQLFLSKKERCRHYHKCGKKPRELVKGRQLNPYKFQCLEHQVSLFFFSKTELEGHCLNHPERKDRNEVTKDLILKMSKEFRKYVHLKRDTIERLSRTFDLSKSSIRKHFRIFKKKEKQN